jgi:hypothetical protein
MNSLIGQHHADVYTAEDGKASTLLLENAEVSFETADMEMRRRFQTVTHLPLARLWASGDLRQSLTDGVQVFWRERETWWTVRGEPTVYEMFAPEMLSVMITANVGDGFFATVPVSEV